jgi:hypothetical protein
LVNNTKKRKLQYISLSESDKLSASIGQVTFATPAITGIAYRFPKLRSRCSAFRRKDRSTRPAVAECLSG